MMQSMAMLDVDLEYPESLYEKTKYFPFCPEKKKPDESKFSDYMNSIKPKKYKPTAKLICDQTNKKHYGIHYRMLKFYIRMGMIVTKIHTIFRFKQSRWLAPYIDFNTKKRMIASKEKNKPAENLYKLANNSYYGKTIENIRERINLDFIPKDNTKEIINRQSKLSFKGIMMKLNEINVYKFNKECIEFSKPIYLGYTVLELSKLIMYEFYYDKFQPYWCENNLTGLYFDTDSMILAIKTPDLEKDLFYFKDDFDFGNLNGIFPEGTLAEGVEGPQPKGFKPPHPLYDPIHDKVIGKMKIETGPDIYIDEFVALRSKSYSYSYGDRHLIKQKGIKIKPKFEEFKSSLFDSMEFEAINRSIRSKNHQVYVSKQTRRSLNPFDDKRYYINSIESIPFRN